MIYKIKLKKKLENYLNFFNIDQNSIVKVLK